MLTSRLWGWLCPSQDLTALSQYEQELRAGDGERDRTDAKVGRLGSIVFFLKYKQVPARDTL